MTRPGRSKRAERRLQVPAAGERPRGHRPSRCCLARGEPGLAVRCPLRGEPVDLDDHEAVQAVEAQCSLHEGELSQLDPVRPDLGLEEASPAGLPPGEHVEEPAQRPAIRGPQPVEDLHGPPGRTDLGEPPGSRGWEPCLPQLAAEGIDPDPAPAADSQVMHDRQLRTRTAPVHGELRLPGPRQRGPRFSFGLIARTIPQGPASVPVAGPGAMMASRRSCLANARVVVAALTDAVFGEVRLVKVVELSIQQDDRPFPAWPGSAPRGLGHGEAAGAGCGRFAGN